MRTMRLTKTIAGILICLAVGGAGGYFFGAQKTEASLERSNSVEFLVEPDTFSRVQNTKNMLDALSKQARTAILHAIGTYQQLPQDSESERKKAEEILDHIIHVSESAMREFDGTEQQTVVAQALLLALQEGGRYERWTEVYLKMLYEHPECPVIVTSAPNAVRFGKLAGQQNQVVAALVSLDCRPLDPVEKAIIREALESASPTLAQTENVHDSIAMTTREGMKAPSSRN